MISRRRFAFWMGFGLFTLSNKLRVYALDELAAAMMGGAELHAFGVSRELPAHWRAADNGVWKWFERERYIDGKWVLSGITAPVNVKTGEPAADAQGYLDENEVPFRVRAGMLANDEGVERDPDPDLQARHGRPPSKWLRSLTAQELSIWLRTIEPPEADVVGMTYWEHLTRDHSFDPVKINGLNETEQAKLHAAAHFGY